MLPGEAQLSFVATAMIEARCSHLVLQQLDLRMKLRDFFRRQARGRGGTFPGVSLPNVVRLLVRFVNRVIIGFLVECAIVFLVRA